MQHHNPSFRILLTPTLPRLCLLQIEKQTSPYCNVDQIQLIVQPKPASFTWFPVFTFRDTFIVVVPRLPSAEMCSVPPL